MDGAPSLDVADAAVELRRAAGELKVRQLLITPSCSSALRNAESRAAARRHAPAELSPKAQSPWLALSGSRASLRRSAGRARAMERLFALEGSDRSDDDDHGELRGAGLGRGRPARCPRQPFMSDRLQ
jgi:hypothetical protein